MASKEGSVRSSRTESRSESGETVGSVPDHAPVARVSHAPDEHAVLAKYLAVENLDEVIPKIARDRTAVQSFESLVRGLHTSHELVHGDARSASSLAPNSIHLVVTSPPYWTLKRYNEHQRQLGHVVDYDEFNQELDEVWRNCYRALVPGGRLIINVGDVCRSRRKTNGRHTVVPLHATIQERCKT
ncbi:MAG: hypothetical protein HZB38_17470, partial [Planctomycetes bacterium]|nr:hypothetical protein [Planctomycetota bacterium]